MSNKKNRPNQRNRMARILAILFSFVLICQSGIHAFAADGDDIVDVTDESHALGLPSDQTLQENTDQAVENIEEADEATPEALPETDGGTAVMSTYNERLNKLRSDTEDMSREEIALLILELLLDVRNADGTPTPEWKSETGGDTGDTLYQDVVDWLGPLDGSNRSATTGKLWQQPQDPDLLDYLESISPSGEERGALARIGDAFSGFFLNEISAATHAENLRKDITNVDEAYSFASISNGDGEAELAAYIKGLLIGLEKYSMSTVTGATGVITPCFSMLFGHSFTSPTAELSIELFTAEGEVDGFTAEDREELLKWLGYSEEWAAEEDTTKLQNRIDDFNAENFKTHYSDDLTACTEDCFKWVAYFQYSGQVKARAAALIGNLNYGDEWSEVPPSILGMYDVLLKTKELSETAVQERAVNEFTDGVWSDGYADAANSDISVFPLAGLSDNQARYHFQQSGAWKADDLNTWKETRDHTTGLAQATSTYRFLKYLSELKDLTEDMDMDTTTELEMEEERGVLNLTEDIIHNFITYGDTEQDVSAKDWRLTPNILTGISLSACYRPLQTNVDDFISEYGSYITNSDNFNLFHMKYGQLRKALLISDTGDSVAKHFAAGEPTNLRVATLNDLLSNPKNDKLLIPQGTYYNRDQLGITYYSIKKFGSYVYSTQQDAFLQFSLADLDEEIVRKDGVVNLIDSSSAYNSGSSLIPADGSMWGELGETLDGVAEDVKDTAEAARDTADAVQGIAGAVQDPIGTVGRNAANVVYNIGDGLYEFFFQDNASAESQGTDLDTQVESFRDKIAEGSTVEEALKETNLHMEVYHEGEIALPYNNTFNTNYDEWRENSLSLAQSTNTNLAVVTREEYRLQDAISHIMKSDLLVQGSSGEQPSVFSGVHRFTGLSITLSILYDQTLRNWMNSSSTLDTPVYISSGKDVVNAPDYIYYNYLQLENIIANNPINYLSAIDRYSPLFMDIYGNILTESGTVVIPIAANASFGGPSTTQLSQSTNAANSPERKFHNWMTVANLTYYGDELYFTQDKDGNTTVGKRIVNPEENSMYNGTMYTESSGEGESRIFTWDEDQERYYLNSLIIAGQHSSLTGPINVAHLSDGDINTLKSLYALNWAMYNKRVPEHTAFDVQKYVTQVLFEVSRGAYWVDIDYAKEGLGHSRRFTDFDISQAAKFENFYESVVSDIQNTILSIPDLAYMEGLDYIIFFLYRILLLTFTLAVSLQVYHQAAKSRLTPLIFIKMVGTYILSFIIIIYMPTIFSASYYQVNKVLLQDEALLLAALEEEKDINGVNLGVTRASSVETQSEILIKVDDIDIPWYRLIGDIAVDPSVSSMQAVYNNYINTLPTTSDKFVIKGNGVYISVSDLLDSSQIFTSADKSHVIKHSVGDTPDASFYLPYYAILDYLVYNINEFNSTLEFYSYKDYLYGDGRRRSVGLIRKYFLSDAFLVTAKDVDDPRFKLPARAMSETLAMASYDKLGLNQFYGNDVADQRMIFTDKEGFKMSQWYREPENLLQLKTRRDNLDAATVAFVVENRSLLGRISDEVFLKILALHLSLEYNEEFRSGGPTRMEISSVATDDILRLSIEEKGNVLMNSPYSYPRFLLESQGLITVYTGAILQIVYLLAGFIKPIATIVIFAAMFLSIYVYKCLLHRSTDNLRGFFWMTIALCAGNLLHGIMLKLSMFLPQTGTPPVICILVQIVLQVAYIVFYLWLTSLIILNWRDLGAQTFRNIFNQRSLRLSRVSAGNWGFGQDMHGGSGSGDPFEARPRKKTVSREEYERMKNLDHIRQNYDDSED